MTTKQTKLCIQRRKDGITKDTQVIDIQEIKTKQTGDIPKMTNNRGQGSFNKIGQHLIKIGNLPHKISHTSYGNKTSMMQLDATDKNKIESRAESDEPV